MTLTLLKRIGKYGILGNDRGDTFLAEAADDDYWGYFKQPVLRIVPQGVRPTLRKIEASPARQTANIDISLPAAIYATWRTVPVPVHDHGPIKVAAYFDGDSRHGYPTADYPNADKSHWLVFEEKQ